MTRKDYELITQVIRDISENGGAANVEALAYRLGQALAATNPRFDMERFMKACGAPPRNGRVYLAMITEGTK